MTMATWPEGLPGPELGGYSVQTGNTLQRTQMDSGRARQRRRFTSVPVIANATWIFSEPEAQVFEGFFKHIINDGADYFELPLKTNMSYKNYIARFTEIYQGPESFGAFDFIYTAQLELKERPLWDKEWIEHGASLILGSSAIDIAANKKWPLA
jgi:hypothetical protein